jgi:hypothetical protein
VAREREVVMRKLALLPVPVKGIVQVMLYGSGDGTYLFLFDAADDAPCVADEWYEHPEDAADRCRQDFGVRPEDCQSVPDPQPGDQHDRLGRGR